MKKKIEINSVQELGRAAQEFIEQTSGHNLIAFKAPMGAGKTTFIKALCEQLGVCDMVNSPTFSIVNEYTDADGQTLAYHFDLYRLKSVAEALDMGAEDYFYSGRYCFIEWPDVADALLPDNCAEASIEEADNGARILSLR